MTIKVIPTFCTDGLLVVTSKVSSDFVIVRDEYSNESTYVKVSISRADYVYNGSYYALQVQSDTMDDNHPNLD